MPSPQSFSLFTEKILAEEVKFMTWCPTADLVLITSLNDVMSLYRNGNTMIWSLNNPMKSKITIVAWKPNGKEIVIGSECGTVYKVDIAYHSPKVSQCWPSNLNEMSSFQEAITSLVWTNYKYKKRRICIDEFEDEAFELKLALPLLSKEPPEEPISRLPIPKQKKVRLPNEPLDDMEEQTLLFVGNKTGQIYVMLNGIYPIGYVDISKDLCKDVQVVDISISNSLSAIQVLTKLESDPKQLLLCTVDIRFLEDKKEEIFNVSKVQTQLNYLLDYSSCTIDVLNRHHESYVRLSKNIAREAENCMLNQNDQSSTMPEIELIGTLATGSVTEVLRDFYIDYLTPQCIKQWETNANHGYQNSLKVVCEHILPACERIQVELSILLGYSLWTRRYGGFLEVDSVEACIDSVQKLVSQLHRFTKSLKSLMKSFQAFATWISSVSQRVSDQNSADAQNIPSICLEPEQVVKYLDTDFTKDSLLEYFLSSPSKTVLLGEQKEETSVIKLLSDTITKCRIVLQKPSETISSKLRASLDTAFELNQILMGTQEGGKVVSSISMDGENKPCIYYAFSQSAPAQKLILLKNNFEKGSVYCTCLNINEGLITDLAFLDNRELGVIIQKNQEASTLQTVLIQDLDFQPVTKSLLKSSDFLLSRTLSLERMINVKIGCNGLPKRRILCVAASNGRLKTYSMDDDESDSDEQNDDE